MNVKQSLAYQDGEWAFANHCSIQSNPYDAQTQAASYRAWDKGWVSVREEARATRLLGDSDMDYDSDVVDKAKLEARVADLERLVIALTDRIGTLAPLVNDHSEQIESLCGWSDYCGDVVSSTVNRVNNLEQWVYGNYEAAGTFGDAR